MVSGKKGLKTRAMYMASSQEPAICGYKDWIDHIIKGGPSLSGWYVEAVSRKLEYYQGKGREICWGRILLKTWGVIMFSCGNLVQIHFKSRTVRVYIVGFCWSNTYYRMVFSAKVRDPCLYDVEGPPHQFCSCAHHSLTKFW